MHFLDIVIRRSMEVFVKTDKTVEHIRNFVQYSLKQTFHLPPDAH